MGFLFEEISYLEIAELVWFGFEADLAEVYDSGRDGVGAFVFGCDEGRLVLGGFIPVVSYSVLDQRVILFEDAIDR